MITAVQLIAVAAEIMPGAEFKKFLLVNHQLPVSDWQWVIEFAWYAGFDPSENIAAMRKQFPQAPEAIFNLMPLDAMRGDCDRRDAALDYFEYGSLWRDDFEDELNRVKAALAKLPSLQSVA
jgi:hypothetical protein